MAKLLELGALAEVWSSWAERAGLPVQNGANYLENSIKLVLPLGPPRFADQATSPLFPRASFSQLSAPCFAFAQLETLRRTPSRASPQNGRPATARRYPHQHSLARCDDSTGRRARVAVGASSPVLRPARAAAGAGYYGSESDSTVGCSVLQELDQGKLGGEPFAPWDAQLSSESRRGSDVAD